MSVELGSAITKFVSYAPIYNIELLENLIGINRILYSCFKSYCTTEARCRGLYCTIFADNHVRAFYFKESEKYLLFKSVFGTECMDIYSIIMQNIFDIYKIPRDVMNKFINHEHTIYIRCLTKLRLITKIELGALTREEMLEYFYIDYSDYTQRVLPCCVCGSYLNTKYTDNEKKYKPPLCEFGCKMQCRNCPEVCEVYPVKYLINNQKRKIYGYDFNEVCKCGSRLCGYV